MITATINPFSTKFIQWMEAHDYYVCELKAGSNDGNLELYYEELTPDETINLFGRWLEEANGQR